MHGALPLDSSKVVFFFLADHTCTSLSSVQPKQNCGVEDTSRILQSTKHVTVRRIGVEEVGGGGENTNVRLYIGNNLNID